MKLNYNITGEDRKQMVAIISREAGVQAVYTRLPECAYMIDSMKVTKTGELLWDGRTDADLIGKIMAALAAAGFTAEEARRVTAKEKATESEKYTFRTFLLRLGFIGADYRQTRVMLMEHLSGHAAFKNQADADTFYAKLKEKKAAAKATVAETTGPETGDAAEEGEDDEISE